MKLTRKDSERCRRFRRAFSVESIGKSDADIIAYLDTERDIKAAIDRQITNAVRRAKHAAYTDLGLVRVRSSVSGRTYYE